MQLAGYYLSELHLYLRLGCEAITLLGSLAYLIGAANEARFQGAQMFVENLVSVSGEGTCACMCVCTNRSEMGTERKGDRSFVYVLGRIE